MGIEKEGGGGGRVQRGKGRLLDQPPIYRVRLVNCISQVILGDVGG